jgi:hypothetical protein
VNALMMAKNTLNGLVEKVDAASAPVPSLIAAAQVASVSELICVVCAITAGEALRLRFLAYG